MALYKESLKNPVAEGGGSLSRSLAQTTAAATETGAKKTQSGGAGAGMAAPAEYAVPSAPAMAQATPAPVMPQFPAYTPTAMPDYSAMLAQIQRDLDIARARALDAAVAVFESQRPGIAAAADDARGQTYANARLSAIGNNEALAAQGLAGSLYGSPATGYSETSRVAQDNNMRTGLAGITKAEMEAGAELDRAIAQARATGEMESANDAAQNAWRMIELQMQQDQAQYERELYAQELAWKQAQYANDWQANEYQTALNKAKILAEYGDYSGYAALGWDTTAMQAAYDAAQGKAKSAAGSSSGTSSGANKSYGAIAAGMEASQDPLGYLLENGGGLTRLEFEKLYERAQSIMGVNAQPQSASGYSAAAALGNYLNGLR